MEALFIWCLDVRFFVRVPYVINALPFYNIITLTYLPYVAKKKSKIKRYKFTCVIRLKYYVCCFEKTARNCAVTRMNTGLPNLRFLVLCT